MVTLAIETRPDTGRGAGGGEDDPAGPDLDQLFPAEQERNVLLVEKVVVSPRDIEVRLRANGIEERALALRPAVPEEVAA